MIGNTSRRRNIIKSVCQIVDKGINLYSPWSGNYNFWPTIKGKAIWFQDPPDSLKTQSYDLCRT